MCQSKFANALNALSPTVTLFQLSSGNSWEVVMEGYVILSSPWSRIYFISFYLVTMVVMTIVVAFVLEAFLFRIQYKSKLGSIERE